MQKRARNLAAEEILIEVIADKEESFSVKLSLNTLLPIHKHRKVFSNNDVGLGRANQIR